MSAEEDLDGFLTLEGSLLEMVYAALCVSRGEKVVPRYETMGVFHDILIHDRDSYVIAECLGEPVVSTDKIASFRESVLTLNERLREVGDDTIHEARIVTMSMPEDWETGSADVMAKLKDDFSADGIQLNLIEPKRVLYDLISNSILGMALYDNHIYFVGPGEWAIRYQPSVSKYRIGISNINFPEFRQLPHSFMPRIYWSKGHRKVIEEYSLFSKEPLPEWFNWSPPYHLGITWKSKEQIKNAIIHTYINDRRQLLYESSSGFLTKRMLKKNSYYTANLVYHKPVMTGDDAIDLDKEMNELVSSARKEGKISEELDFYSRIFTDTITFTHSYWANSLYNRNRGKVSYTEIHRGEDVLMEALNNEVLGMKLSGGRIALSTEDSPNTMKIVQGGLHWESEHREVYPARVKF